MKDLASHFEFGRNWSSYAALVDENRVNSAVQGLERLVRREEVSGKSFLDIGCGSGLHSLSALRLGASRVLGVDLDPHSVAAGRSVLSRFAPEGNWEIRESSVFDLDPNQLGTFDVVYSWGVLHHTGAMYEAWRSAARMVSPGGLLAVALYRKTRLCSLWKVEKRIYTRSPPVIQRCFRGGFVVAMRLRCLLTGRSFRQHCESYGNDFRGMDFYHDVHDWMGGYPYESISPAEADRFRRELGFTALREFVQSGTRLGLFGSGNDEYVWKKP